MPTDSKTSCCFANIYSPNKYNFVSHTSVTLGNIFLLKGKETILRQYMDNRQTNEHGGVHIKLFTKADEGPGLALKL